MLPRRAPRFWQENGGLATALLPLSHLYGWLAQRRRSAYLQGRRTIIWPQAPVMVIGNISVGGTGKTPLVIWTANRAAELGYRPAVVLRGYGGASRGPVLVTAADSPRLMGDEAVLIARQTGLPVAIGVNRAAAAQLLVEQANADLIISDDGLQHYAMGRDVEIAVVDANRGQGNARCLPSGPLREPVERLETVDWVVSNGPPSDASMGQFSMQLAGIHDLGSEEPVALPFGKVHAVAGIGNPSRFFDALTQLGYPVIPHAFPDHHQFKPDDLSCLTDYPVLMTEKDAVKCQSFNLNNAFYVRANAQPDDATQAQMENWLTMARQRFDQREAQ